MKKYFIKTFGCAMNYADSEKINMILLQSGFFKTNEVKEADLVIFNTCSVRQKGEDRVFGFIQEIEKEEKKLRMACVDKKQVIGITGCMVRKTGLSSKYLEEDMKRKKAKKIEYLESKNSIFNNDDKLFPRSERLDFTLRIEEVKYLPFILTHVFGESIGNDDKFDDYLKSKQQRENPFSANIIIQTGCDNYCSFCIVPYTRGKELSRPEIEILEEAREAVTAGAKEITLIGQNVNSYGKQFAPKKLWNEKNAKWNEESFEGGFKSPFRKLLEELNKIDGLDRIRFTSSNPHDMTKDILDAHFDLDKTCNYLHFALQSGSDEMLKRMNRKHSYQDFKKIVDYLRSRDPLFAVSTDIIVGYSGENQEMFEQTVNTFKECSFDFSYTARYSVRKGTIASKIYPDNVSNTTKAERWHKLNDLLLENILERNKLMLGREEKILVSGKKDQQAFGRTRNFKEVFFDDDGSISVGDIVTVKIEEIDKYVLKGSLI